MSYISPFVYDHSTAGEFRQEKREPTPVEIEYNERRQRYIDSVIKKNDLKELHSDYFSVYKYYYDYKTNKMYMVDRTYCNTPRDYNNGLNINDATLFHDVFRPSKDAHILELNNIPLPKEPDMQYFDSQTQYKNYKTYLASNVLNTPYHSSNIS